MPKLIELKPDELVIRGSGKLSFDHILLVPGINYQLSAEEVDKVLSHPDLPRYIGKGLKVYDSANAPAKEVVDPAANSDLADLTAFPVDQVDEIIQATHDAGVIEKWLAVEKRKTVRQQLNNRLEAIKGGRE